MTCRHQVLPAAVCAAPLDPQALALKAGRKSTREQPSSLSAPKFVLHLSSDRSCALADIHRPANGDILSSKCGGKMSASPQCLMAHIKAVLGQAMGSRLRAEEIDRMVFGDFCQRTYHLACLFARLLCYDNSYIVRLCACCRALKPTKNPAQSGTFVSGNRLNGLPTRSAVASRSGRRAEARRLSWRSLVPPAGRPPHDSSRSAH